MQTPFPQTNPFYARPASLIEFDTPRPSLLRRFRRRNTRRLVIISLLCLLLLAAASIVGVISLSQRDAGTAGINAQVTIFYVSSTVPGGFAALSIFAHRLTAPPAGDAYNAWYI